MLNTNQKLEILSRLSRGEISSEEAERLLTAAEREPDRQETMDIEHIRDMLYDLMDVSEDIDEEEEDEDEAERQEEIRDIIDSLSPEPAQLISQIQTLIDEYDLEPEFIVSIFPMLPDNEEAFNAAIDSWEENGLYESPESLTKCFTMTMPRIKRVLGLYQDECCDIDTLPVVIQSFPQKSAELTDAVMELFRSGLDGSVLINLLNDNLLALNDQAIDNYIMTAATNGFPGITPEELIPVLMSLKSNPVRPEPRVIQVRPEPKDPWENIFTDCFIKVNEQNRSINNGRNNFYTPPIPPFPTYDSISVNFPNVDYKYAEQNIDADSDEDISARKLNIQGPCSIAGNILANDIRAAGQVNVSGELKSKRVHAQELILNSRSCFDRMRITGRLQADEILAGNLLSCEGETITDDLQVRIIESIGLIEANGAVYSVSLGATGQGEFKDTIRSENINLMGDMHVCADVHCGNLSINGKLTADKNLWISNTLRVQGEAKFRFPVVAPRISVNGAVIFEQGVSLNNGMMEVMGECTAMGKIDNLYSFSLNGKITGTDIGALVNWTKVVDLTLSGGDSSLDTITAVTTRVCAIDNSVLNVIHIGGYSIDVKNTNAELLRANYVAVGPGCHIKLLQYINNVSIHPEAVVERTEKISPN